MNAVLKISKNNYFKKSVLLSILLLLSVIWLRGGLDTFYIDTDFGRDLSELSKLWIGQKAIWLGPTLSPGFHASPLYYYLFYPALFLGGGSAYSLLLSNILLSLVFLGIFGYLGIVKKQGVGIIFAVMVIGLSPLFRSLVLHPGNGYTYVLWLLLSLTFLWFELPFLFSSLFLGIAISFHPAGFFVVPILIYEWMRRKHEWKQAICIIGGLVVPWAPIIVFEIITKGYLFRQWLMHPGVGMTIAPSLINVQSLAGNLSLSLYGLVILLAVLVWLGSKREKMWLIIGMSGLIFFIVVSKVPSHYILGLTGLFLFIGVVLFSERWWGRAILGLLTFLFVMQIIIGPPPVQSIRSIGKIQRVVNKLIQSKAITKTDKIAVVAALDLENKVPQADDYRFFLRTKGLTVLEVINYKDANKMILFVENSQFDWERWSTWETEQIGSKRIIQIQEEEGIKIITFEKLR